MSIYTQPPATFEELVAPFPESTRQTAFALRDLIRAALPGAGELVSGGLKIANVLYSLGRPTNVVCGIQPTDTHCKLYLHHVRPGDVAGLKVDGSGKNARHVKVTSAADAGRPEIAEALALARRGAGGDGGILRKQAEE